MDSKGLERGKPVRTLVTGETTAPEDLLMPHPISPDGGPSMATCCRLL